MDKKKSKGVDGRKKLILAGSMHWVHWCIVLLSILLTIGAWYFSKQQLAEKIEVKFLREADQTVELVKERMELYENALWGGVALIDSNQGEIFYDQWLAYSKSLQIDTTYPGINGIGVIFNIKPNEMESYLAKERTLRPDYHLHPQHDKSEFWPITYIEPAEPNKKAVGLDMAFEKNRYTSVIKARDTGKAQVTGPIVLVQDSKKTPGFLFYAPFYKNGLRPDNIEDRQTYIVGVTYAPFIMNKLMQGTLAQQKRQVRLNISDKEELLYTDDTENESGIDPNPLFSKQIDVEMYGRTWVFDIQSSLSFRQGSSNNQPMMILISGIIIDSLLLALFIFLSRANRNALAYADQMLEDLQDKTMRLEASNRDLEQYSYLASHDLKSPLNAIIQMVGWLEEDCRDLIPNDSKAHLSLLKQRGHRMIKLLDDLFEYSRVNRFEYTNESINLKAMVTDLVYLIDESSKFSIIAPNNELNIPRIPFEIVIRNLVSNAIKHHDKDHGEIIISYESLTDFHRICVQDDGPGIPIEFQQKALEMFKTLQPRDKVEGSGMGLSIAKKIIEHHDGRIQIDCKHERGTTFIIMWPKKEPENT